MYTWLISEVYSVKAGIICCLNYIVFIIEFTSVEILEKTGVDI